MKKIFFVLLLAAAAPAAALELSLEENKGESGTIGYVDIDRVFKEFSGTSNARDEFLAEIKAKEDSLNLKKQAIFSLKADIAKLKQEREFALTLPGLMRQAEEISAAAAASVASVSAGSPLSTGAVKADIPAGISTQTAAIQPSTGPALMNPSASVSVADSASGPRQASVSPEQEAKVKRMKDILFRLVRQDEYLDEAIETLDTPNAKPAAADIFALSLSLKMIKGNLDHVTALNKIQLTEIQPESNLSLYTKTILSYSSKMNKKVNRVRLLASSISAKNKKAAMRDAVSAKKGGGARGKNIAQLLEEQRAMEQLSTDIKYLKSSLNQLTATSRWLYIVSK